MKTTSIAPVDLKNVPGGSLDMCAGSLTPWNTHLGGEEYDYNGEQQELIIQYCSASLDPLLRWY